MENGVSKFKIHCVGIVAKDIKEDSKYIDVFPIELQPGKDGDIAEKEEMTHDVVDIEGNVESIIVDKTTLLRCKWLPVGEPNRLESPTICKGESVLVYRFANTDNYFWTPMYNEFHLRKKEKYTLMLSNRSTVVDGKDNLDKSYYLMFDTINKFIRLHTDDSDGEATKYDIEINTSEGTITILDGEGNEITLDSPTGSLSITTNSSVNVTTPNANVMASETITATAPAIVIKGGITKIN